MTYEVTQADAITIPELKKHVRYVWKQRPNMARLSVVLLRKLPDRGQTSGRTVSRPEGLPKEYEAIAGDMAEGFHAVALMMEIPSEDATGFHVLPPYDERSLGLIQFLHGLRKQCNEGDYVIGEFGGTKVKDQR
ncbi:MAG: hypothetical protein LAO03_10235 [Acidobacteriia bacterium]|nr:hypothetical protein [Terriglobia bacterium]